MAADEPTWLRTSQHGCEREARFLVLMSEEVIYWKPNGSASLISYRVLFVLFVIGSGCLVFFCFFFHFCARKRK